jgi:hypothetical protein
MKHYTLAKFKLDGYQIPNLPDDYAIEHDTDNGIVWVRVKASACYTAEELDGTGWEPDKMMELFSIYTNSDGDPRWRDTSNDRMLRMGLLNRKNYEAGRSGLDALYHLANPINYYHGNGKLKRGFWNTLRERIYGRGKYSWQTLEMFQFAMRLLHEEFPDEDDEHIKYRLYDKSSIHPSDVFKCPINGNWYPDFLRSHKKFENEFMNIHWQVNPLEYGWVNVGADADWFMKPDQVVHRGRVYNRNELVLTTCPQCDQEVVEGDMVDGICRTCHENKYKIHNYSTRVPTLLKFKASNVKPGVEPLYFGLELEYETSSRDKAKVKVCDLLAGHAILKSDGSINNGFEIVTCPATKDIQLEVFKNFFDNMPRELEVADNVGMHIHISRKPLNMFTIGKMTEFLNRDNNKAFITYVAGRQPNRFCGMQDSRTITYPLYDKGDRYNTLNLQPTDTVEMRIFSTPKNYQEFAQRLEFADALVRYCGPAQLGVPLKELTQYGTFLKWVHKNHKDYPELANHLKGI